MLGNLDSGQVISGYLGLILMSAAYTGIGIFASSLGSNQIVAFLAALFIGLFFHIIFGVVAANLSGVWGEVVSYLSLQNHFQSMSRGVLDSRDIIYFLSLAFTGLLLAEYSLTKRTL
jgi:ABC-2 type transport system permease protein